MFITKMSLPRRTFLRGMGATMALPLLEAMVPALTARAQTAARPVRRFAGIYVPHGCVMDLFTPEQSGPGFAFTPILQPLEPYRESLVLVTGVNGPASVDGGGHALAPASWLTASTAKKTQGADIRAGVSIDQVLAREIGKETVFPSLELATEDFSETVGSCEIGFSCAYMNTISWSSPTTPVPMELNPRVVFERLFGGTGTSEQRKVQRLRTSSILDDIRVEAGRLQRRLGPQDSSRIDDYLANIREIEQRIQKAERTTSDRIDTPEVPSGIPDTFVEHVALQFDLLAVAFQADLTRVASFMNGRDVTYHNYPELGFTDGHHPLSHHGNNADKKAKFAKVNTYEMTMFAKFLERLRTTPDGEGSLLDHSVVLYGSGMSHGYMHSHTGLPVIIAGGGAGTIKGDRHLKHPVSATDGIPNGNVLVSIARTFGCELTEFGQSNGAIDL
jgi:Protein of unknown function (DUF1552)